MGIIITLVIAAIVGWIASMIMKTDGQMGWMANIVAGIVGSFIGTALFGFIAPGTPTDNGLNVMGILVGVAGACIAIYVWKMISGRNHI